MLNDFARHSNRRVDVDDLQKVLLYVEQPAKTKQKPHSAANENVQIYLFRLHQELLFPVWPAFVLLDIISVSSEWSGNTCLFFISQMHFRPRAEDDHVEGFYVVLAVFVLFKTILWCKAAFSDMIYDLSSHLIWMCYTQIITGEISIALLCLCHLWGFMK